MRVGLASRLGYQPRDRQQHCYKAANKELSGRPRIARMRLFLAAAAAILLSISTAAQVFKATTDLIIVPLAVTTRGGDRPAGDLAAADFRVREDGVEQKIVLLDRQRRPLSLCIVLDSSTSMQPPRQDLARQAVDATIGALSPDDEFAMVVFARGVNVAVPWTAVKGKLQIAWSSYQLADGTALNDALKQALELVNEAHNERVAVLIVSDGEENESRIRLPQIVSTRRQSEVLVYAFSTDAPVMTPPPTRADAQLGPERSNSLPPASTFGFTKPPSVNALPSLVGDSGGVLYPVSTSQNAGAAATALIEELRTLYTLGYEPAKAPDGPYRRIKVEPRSGELRVRHRAGYLSRVPQ
jgi:Ca-activated chloride channel homolog